MHINTNLLEHVRERALIQVDQWDNVEKGRGPEPEHLRERGQTLVGILDLLIDATDTEEENDFALVNISRAS